MVDKTQLAGTQGVHLVAAELNRRGFVVALTSGTGSGAHLLVTDRRCRQAFSVRVETNAKPRAFWLVEKQALAFVSESHLYVFVALRGEQAPLFHVVSR